MPAPEPSGAARSAGTCTSRSSSSSSSSGDVRRESPNGSDGLCPGRDPGVLITVCAWSRPPSLPPSSPHFSSRPTAPPASAGALNLSSNASRFDAYTGFTRENFEGSEVPDGDSAYCGVSLSAFTTSACYATGVLQTGFVLEIAEAGSDGVVAGGPGYHSTSSTTVLANNYNETLVVRFTDPTDTVGFRVSSEMAGQCSVTVRYADASPATTRSVPCPASPASRWVGIEADRRISSVRLTGADSFTHLDDLAFGVRPPNRIRVGSAVAAPALGTARLPVTVPGIGITTVRGPAIVGASLDSARRRVHRFRSAPADPPRRPCAARDG